MQKIYRVALIIILSYTLLPTAALASTVKTISGTVTKIYGSQITFSTTSAATYMADAGSATLVRKNGAVMQFSEIIVGDKVEVTGTLWGDNSISATYITDKSVYAHNSSFTGKITSINTTNSSFIMESKTYGSQTIYTNNFTSFSKNGSSAVFNDLQLGMTTTVKGQWDRNTSQIIASAVAEKFRLISIYFTGTVSLMSSNSVTVIGNGNVIYGVDLSKATLESKNGKTITVSDVHSGDNLRVWGKHISGSVQIVGVKIKDSSITK